MVHFLKYDLDVDSFLFEPLNCENIPSYMVVASWVILGFGCRSHQFGLEENVVSSFFTDILQTKQPVLKIIDSYIPDLCVLGKHKFTAVIVALLDVFFFFLPITFISWDYKICCFFSSIFYLWSLNFHNCTSAQEKENNKEQCIQQSMTDQTARSQKNCTCTCQPKHWVMRK